MREQVRVWHGRDREQQHYADPSGSDTDRTWAGSTRCGLDGELVWIPPERVDAGSQCPRCLALTGAAPPLQGDDPGPV